MAKAERFAGIDLGGSRRTAVVTLDFFPAEKKIFLAEMDSPVTTLGDETADEALVRLLQSIAPLAVGVDAPLTLPPCLNCREPSCPGVRRCPREEVGWMRSEAERLKWGKGKLPTPYSQRPVDLLLRGQWQEEVNVPFPVEDSFGSGRAPHAARMQFLLRLLPPFKWFEVVPRLALASLAPWFQLSNREVRRSRDLEEGVEQRLGILDAMGQVPRVSSLPHLFLYKADIASLAQDLAAFDAFLCGYFAVLGSLGLLLPPPFPELWGNVARPRKFSELS